MKISLPEFAKVQEIQHKSFMLTDRLPQYINGNIVVDCTFHVKKHDNGYILSLKTQAKPEIICQRCLNLFKYDYFYSNDLLICDNEDIANSKMQQYECVVVKTYNIVLQDILTDDLYLFLPDKHPQNECSFENLTKYLN